ncbi:AI-2E family transporter [Stakelama sediminis]|uniref:Putative PurR-regulated permease PerM n=1 Tax=Stakelama sediminis TaxID=463200 RepID=A0A840YVS7_9SPHN|nr:AI-2E family transporter [Stakelama sediminis]MBB5717748.1 putative PurR-regulated permease PerM [Stakelama sediminis]
MSSEPEPVQQPGPNEMRDPATRAEVRRALVWFSIAAAIALIVLLIQPLLIIFGGLVFAAMLDGGVRLLGRVLPIPRGFRLLIVVLLATAFVLGTFYMAGMQIAAQASQLRTTLETQADRVIAWAANLGIMPHREDITGLVREGMGSIGKLTSALGTAVGAVTTMFMILVIGLFVAMEPRIYDRGLQWMVPLDRREDFAVTIDNMALTMRRLLAGRLLGMAFEGTLTWLALWAAGVPMALLLGILTGLLAFIPNIGAFISGMLMAAVGFSAGVDTGLWAIGIYIVVQTFDGYVVIPMVARRTVDLPPALTLSAQILTSALFGILGLALADPMVAMIKVALERKSEISARGAVPHE